MLCIILSVLLGEQNGGSTGIVIIYLISFGLFFMMSILSMLFNKWTTRDDIQFIAFVNAHKRIDSQAEQIAFSGDDVRLAEENQLRTKLDSSVRSQLRSGFYFSIIIGIVKLSLSSFYLIGYAIPAAIFFHTYYEKGVSDPKTAQTFITLSVYMANLYAPLSLFMYFSDPIRRIQSIGTRVTGCLGRWIEILVHVMRKVIVNLSFIRATSTNRNASSSTFNRGRNGKTTCVHRAKIERAFPRPRPSRHTNSSIV